LRNKIGRTKGVSKANISYGYLGGSKSRAKEGRGLRRRVQWNARSGQYSTNETKTIDLASSKDDRGKIPLALAGSEAA